MGLILDLAVVALAAVVVVSLAALAWTLAVTAVRATHRGRAQVAGMRASVTDAEARVRSSAQRATAAMTELSRRTDRYTTRQPGERSDR